jgi:hypothetical protein
MGGLVVEGDGHAIEHPDLRVDRRGPCCLDGSLSRGRPSSLWRVSLACWSRPVTVGSGGALLVSTGGLSPFPVRAAGQDGVGGGAGRRGGVGLGPGGCVAGGGGVVGDVGPGDRDAGQVLPVGHRGWPCGAATVFLSGAEGGVVPARPPPARAGQLGQGTPGSVPPAGVLVCRRQSGVP